MMAKVFAALSTHHVHAQRTVCLLQKGLHEAEASGQKPLLAIAPAVALRHSVVASHLA